MAIEVTQTIIIFIAILAMASGVLVKRSMRRSMVYNLTPPNISRPDVTPSPQRNFDQLLQRVHHVRSTEELFRALEMIDAKLFRTFVLYQVKTGLTKEQYDFFSSILNEYLKYLQIKKDDQIEKVEEKTTKLQWIEKQREGD